MKPFMHMCFIGLGLALCAMTASAQQEQDELRLRSGAVLRGRLSEADNNTIVFRAADGIKSFPRADVSMIILGGAAAPTGGLPPGLSVGEGLRVASWHTFTRISNFQRGDDAQFIRDVFISDDGNRIAFSSQKGIFTIGAEGAGLKQITNVPPETWDATPDLKKFIWWERTRGLNFTTDDGISRKLPGEMNVLVARITAPGDRAFVLVPERNVLIAVSTDGSGIKNVTTTEAITKVHGSIEVNGNLYKPFMAVSADGSHVILQYAMDIYGMNGDGSGLRRLTQFTSYNLDHFAISPDGNKIAYHESVGSLAIRVMDWNGGNKRDYTGEPAYVQAVQVINDGTVQSHMRDDQGARLRLLYPDGQINDLMFTGNYGASEVGIKTAHMTPNGRRIVFPVAGQAATDGGRPSQLWLCDIKPATINGAPTLTNILAFPRFLLTDGSTKAVITVDTNDRDPEAVGAFNYRKNIIDYRDLRWDAYSSRMNDQGQNADEKAGDGKWSTGVLQLNKGPQEVDAGPLMLRVFGRSKTDRMLVVDLEGMEARRP